eukprot:UN03182
MDLESDNHFILCFSTHFGVVFFRFGPSKINCWLQKTLRRSLVKRVLFFMGFATAIRTYTLWPLYIKIFILSLHNIFYCLVISIFYF